MLTAALNDARFRLNSRDISIPGAELLRQNFSNVPIVKGFAFEGVANRNSLGYLKEYGLPEDLPTTLRGSKFNVVRTRSGAADEFPFRQPFVTLALLARSTSSSRWASSASTL